MKAEDSSALLPGEDAGRGHAVEVQFAQRPEEGVPVDLALADVEMLVDKGRGSGLPPGPHRRHHPEAGRLGYDVVLSAAAQARSEAKALEALLGHRCEALILLGPDAEPAYLDGLGQRAVTVSVRRRVPRARVDFVHSAEGVRQATDHLVELGHRGIVHIDGGRGPGSAGRRHAYRAAMRSHGLEADAWVIPGEHNEQSGIETDRCCWRSATGGCRC